MTSKYVSEIIMHELGYEIGEEIDYTSFTMNYTVGLYVICIEIKPT
jgi:hypothetical protein